MSRDVVEIALIEVASSQGLVRMATAKSLTVSYDDKKKAIKTMNDKRRAIGFVRGVPDFTADLEAAIENKPTSQREVDWYTLGITKEIFQIFYEENSGGQRWQLVDCAVDSISDPYNADGETMETIKISFLDKLPE